MNRFQRQRWIGWMFFLVASASMILAHRWFSPHMVFFTHISGWVLLALMIFLTLFNARKKIPFLPVFSAETWLQWHIYIGLLTGTLFLVHVCYRMPTGWFEGTLAWLYALVMGSGIFGMVVSRSIPKRLTQMGHEVLQGRIPERRRQLQHQAESMALNSLAESESPTIARFYVEHLKSFFDRPRNFWLHLVEVRRPLNDLLARITDLNRYLNDQEKDTMSEMADLVRQKNGLDYHWTMQWVLRAWLFVHIPLTYSLLLFSLVHIVLIYAFSGGAR